MRHKVLNDNIIKNSNKTSGVNILPVIVLLGLLTACAVYLGLYRDWIGTNPFASYTINDVSDIVSDAEGNTYIISDATTTVLKLSQEGELIDRAILSHSGIIESATHIAIGGDGNLYLHEVVKDQGIVIECEKICRLDPELKNYDLIDTISEKDSTVRQSVAGISGTENGVIYVKKNPDGMTLYDEKGVELSRLTYEKADENIMYAVTDKTGDEVFYSTYNGKVCRYIDGINDDVIYDSDMEEGSIPQDISYADGLLYVTDIGLRDIVIIDLQSGKIERLSTEGSIKERPIEYFVSGDYRMVSAGDYSITFWDDNDSVVLSEVIIRATIKVRIIITYVALLYIGLSVVFVMLGSLKYIMKRTNIYVRIGLCIILGVVAVVSLIIGTLFPDFNSRMTDKIYEKEMLVASRVEEQIPNEAFLALNKPSDFMNDDYKAVSKAVNSVFELENIDLGAYYCVLYRVIDGVVTLTYTMEDICVLYPYNWEYEGTGFQELMEEGKVQSYVSDDNTGNYILVQYPIHEDDGSIIGFIEVGTDMKSVSEHNKPLLFSLLLNVFAMTVAVIIFVIELMYYIRDRNEYIRKKRLGKAFHLTPGIFRFIVFLIFLFTNLTCVILPIHARQIADNERLFGLSSTMLAAIPISAEVLSGAVFSVLGGRIIEKLGAKRTVVVSSALFTIGLFIRVIPDIIALILGSLILGAGWAVLLIMVNVQIAELSEEKKDKGYSYYNVSSISGINCGVILGGFMVQWFPYTVIFLITAELSVLLFFVCRRFLADNMPNAHGGSEDEKPDNTDILNTADSNGDVKAAVKLILCPRVISFFGMILTPLLICGYFLNYLFPILGSDWGLSDSHISFAFMISGIIVLCFGTPLTKMFAKRNLRRFGLVTALILYAEAFLGMALLQNVPSLIIALVLIGFADSFGIPLLTSYFTELDEVEDFGYDRAFGVYSLFENGAQSLGSFILGIVYDIGVQKGMFILAGAVTVLALLFFFISSLKRRSELQHD